MDPEFNEDEQSLKQEFEGSELALEKLESELAESAFALDKLAAESHRYVLLRSICNSLDELHELGADDLFWHDDDSGHTAGQQRDHAQESLQEFDRRVAAAEAHREQLLDQIGEQNAQLDYLHYELRDAMDLAEQRENEWLPHREADDLPNRTIVMPWARGCEEDSRFRRSLTASFAASIAVGLLVSVVALPVQELDQIVEVPERVARLVREERPAPPPPVVEPILAEEIPPVQPDPEPVEEQPPEPTPVVAEAPAQAQAPAEDTREQVKSKGILAFRDSFAARNNERPDARLGMNADLSSAGRDAVGRPQRSMVSTTAAGSSGGINLADISRDVGGGAAGDGLGGVEVVQASSSIGGAEGTGRPLSAGMSAGRTDEEIQIVFDRYKAALYRLYNRELRKDPTLRGQLVLRLTIEPDGSVSFCELQSTDMEAPLLAEQVVARVRGFDFGAKEDIVAMTIIYPIDFLPAV